MRRVKEGKLNRSRMISNLEESLPNEIIQWFEGPSGFDNNEVNLRIVIDAYKEVLDSIEPYEIFSDY